MSKKWAGLERPITAADAEAEPEYERLFARPPRWLSPEINALFAQIERQRKERYEHATKSRRGARVVGL